MSLLFSQSDADDLVARELPRPPVQASIGDLHGSVLFGAGRFSRALLHMMRRNGLEPAWIVDNNPALWNGQLEGVKIRPASSLHEAGDRVVLIMTTFVREMAQACQDAGVRRWAWFTDIHEVFGDLAITISAEKVLFDPEIDRLTAILRDAEESRCTLRSALKCRVTGDPADFPICSPAQYFSDDLVPLPFYSHFVDCGAYDGDTLREWLSRKAPLLPPEQFRYHAFEPDPDNFSMLRQFVTSLPGSLKSRIVLHSCGVGDVSGNIGMIQGGLGTELYQGIDTGIVAPIVRLDEVLAHETVRALKMDVEGFEPQALEGARSILENQRPALLISIYHRPEHLWKIPLWIHDLGLGYHISLRHHDTTSSETVCYAVPMPFPDSAGTK